MPRPKTGRKRGRPVGSVDSSPRDLQLLERLHKSQAKIHRRRQALVGKIAALPMGTAVPIELIEQQKRLNGLEESIEKTDAFLAKCSSAIVSIKKAVAQEHEGLSDEQLQAQLTAEFLASIKTWGPEQWAVVEEHQRMRSGT